MLFSKAKLGLFPHSASSQKFLKRDSESKHREMEIIQEIEKDIKIIRFIYSESQEHFIFVKQKNILGK